MDISNIIKNGGIVVMPTDTVYGIVCDATNEKAVDKVYQLKNRDYSKAMIVLVSGIDMLKRCVSSINDLEEEIINKYTPGPLTIIFNKSDFIPDIVTSGMDTVGIRIPNDKELLELIDRVGNPVIASSANVSNNDTITSIDLLEDSIKNNVDYIVDGGYINRDASTIIKVDENNIKILRDGKMSNIIKEDYKDFII